MGGRAAGEAAGTSSDLPTADPYLPGHGDPSWSAAHYALDLDYDLAGNRLRAEAVIDAVAEEDLTRVVLDLAGLDVAKVTVDGRPPAKYAVREQPARRHPQGADRRRRRLPRRREVRRRAPSR